VYSGSYPAPDGSTPSPPPAEEVPGRDPEGAEEPIHEDAMEEAAEAPIEEPSEESSGVGEPEAGEEGLEEEGPREESPQEEGLGEEGSREESPEDESPQEDSLDEEGPGEEGAEEGGTAAESGLGPDGPGAVANGASPESREESRGDDRIAQARMLSYLMTLTGDLPEEQRTSFSNSDVPLRIAALQSKLLGQHGLRRDVARYDMAGRAQRAPVTKKRLADTFSFVAQMARYHPDKTISSALRERVGRLLERLQGNGRQ